MPTLHHGEIKKTYKGYTWLLNNGSDVFRVYMYRHSVNENYAEIRVHFRMQSNTMSSKTLVAVFPSFYAAKKFVNRPMWKGIALDIDSSIIYNGMHITCDTKVLFNTGKSI